jgi:hypothetical protein
MSLTNELPAYVEREALRKLAIAFSLDWRPWWYVGFRAISELVPALITAGALNIRVTPEWMVSYDWPPDDTLGAAVRAHLARDLETDEFQVQWRYADPA